MLAMHAVVVQAYCTFLAHKGFNNMAPRVGLVW